MNHLYAENAVLCLQRYPFNLNHIAFLLSELIDEAPLTPLHCRTCWVWSLMKDSIRQCDNRLRNEDSTDNDDDNDVHFYSA